MDLGAIEESARTRLDAMAFDYAAGGAGDEITVTENVAAWRSMRLRPRFLRDVTQVSTVTSVLGTTIAAPVLVAPTAMHRLFCPEGELATARAAAHAGTVYVLSLAATTSLEDVAAQVPGAPRWMQLYVQRDRGLTRAVCERAHRAGYEALVVTVDSPVTSKRPRNEKNAFHLPPGLTLPNLAPHHVDTPDIFELVAAYDASLTFDDLATIAEWSGGLPIVVKGLVRGDDAVRCIEAGAAAVAVSNHGGRQLDTCIATAHALAEVVEAVDGRAEVYVDGGIRDGADIVKALALGARAVMVGRPVVWGLAIGGAEGAADVLRELTADLARTMGLCGLADARAVPRDLVTP